MDTLILTLKDSLVARKKAHGNGHLSVAGLYNSIGVLCEMNGDLREALGNYKLSLAIRENVLGRYHDHTRATQKNIKSIEKRAPYLK